MYTDGSKGTRSKKIIPYLVFIPCAILYIIDFMGCVISLPSLFMVSVPVGSGSSLHVGHSGICLLTNASTGNRCLSTSNKSEDAIATLLGLNDNPNSLAALRLVLTLQKKVVLPYLLPVAGGLLVFAGISMGIWEFGHRQKIYWKYVGFGLFSVSSSLALAAAVSTSMAIGALVVGSEAIGGPHMVQGRALQGVEWSAVALHHLISASFVGLTLNRFGLGGGTKGGLPLAGGLGGSRGPGGPLSL